MLLAALGNSLTWGRFSTCPAEPTSIQSVTTCVTGRLETYPTAWFDCLLFTSPDNDKEECRSNAAFLCRICDY